jgi:hypothetical protein
MKNDQEKKIHYSVVAILIAVLIVWGGVIAVCNMDL